MKIKESKLRETIRNEIREVARFDRSRAMIFSRIREHFEMINRIFARTFNTPSDSSSRGRRQALEQIKDSCQNLINEIDELLIGRWGKR